jgi:hypothetical protein
MIHYWLKSLILILFFPILKKGKRQIEHGGRKHPLAYPPTKTSNSKETSYNEEKCIKKSSHFHEGIESYTTAKF